MIQQRGAYMKRQAYGKIVNISSRGSTARNTSTAHGINGIRES